MSFANQALSAEYIVRNAERPGAARSTSCRTTSTARSRASSSSTHGHRDRHADARAGALPGLLGRGHVALRQPHDIIRLEDEAVVLLDQTRLPAERVERSCRTVADLVDAIQVLAIRGAPALGVAGAMGVALAARTGAGDPVGMRRLAEQGAKLAVRAADGRQPRLGRRRGALRARPRRGANPRRRAGVAARARRIHGDEVARCRAMGAHGAALFGERRTADPVQRRRPRDRRLRHRPRRRAGPGRARRRPARVGARDPPAAAGRAPDGVRAGRGGHRPHARDRQRRGAGPARGGVEASSSAPTASPPTATRRTRSAPTTWPSWRTTTASRSTWSRRPRRSTRPPRRAS